MHTTVRLGFLPRKLIKATQYPPLPNATQGKVVAQRFYANDGCIGYLEEAAYVASILDAGRQLDDEELYLMIEPFFKQFSDLSWVIKPILDDM